MTPEPAFLWTGASFRLALANTPAVSGKLLALHSPALPFGWRSEVAVVDGLILGGCVFFLEEGFDGVLRFRGSYGASLPC